jgi:hypothetical protein
MAMGVVDLLQAVDVEIDNARWQAVAPSESDHAQLSHEGTPICDRRKRILVGEAFDWAIRAQASSNSRCIASRSARSCSFDISLAAPRQNGP